MNISGIIVLAAPAKFTKVKEQLLALPGVEIPVEDENGRMVVIIDETNAKASGEVLMKIQGIDGVLSANLVYQHADDQGETGKPGSNDAENLQ